MEMRVYEPAVVPRRHPQKAEQQEHVERSLEHFEQEEQV
jgi:hypothetical protein